MKLNMPLTLSLMNGRNFKHLFKIMKLCFFLLFVFVFQSMATNTKGSEYLNPALQQQEKTVKGTVTDLNGEPVIGATIIVKNNPSQGTVTDINGYFVLSNLQENTVLQITYVGMKPLEINTIEKTTIDIVMEADTELLDEVVVVGYGTQRKINLTGAVSQVSSEVLENRPITNLGQGLQGMIPNLNITQTTGTTGSGATFNIRGFTSITGGGPLILVDGVPMDANLINPNDIESVSVLKDAASAAIYGARAAFGVILISTKSGKKDGKPKISLSMNYGINHPTFQFSIMDAKQRMEYMNAASYMQNGKPYTQFDDETVKHLLAYYNDPENNPSAFPDPNNPRLWRGSANTDWPRILQRDYMPQQQYTVSVQGGADKFNYYTSLGYFFQKGIPKQFDEKYKRYNFITNLTYGITDWITLGAKMSFNKSYKYYPPNNRSGHHHEFTTAYQWYLTADSPVYAPNGKYFSTGSIPNMVQFHKEGGYRSRDVNDLWLTGTVKLTPFKNMTLNLDYSANYMNQEEEDNWKRLETYYIDGTVSGYFPFTNPSQMTRKQYNNKYYILNTYADYENTFGVHYIKVMAGFNQENGKYSNFYAKRENLIVETMPYMNLAYGEKSVGDGATHYAIRGAFARFNYNFADRYLFEFNGRYDGSSRFPQKERFKFFPSASIGWRLDNEPFLSGVKNIFNLLKLRASYGNLGNQVVESYYPYIATYDSGQADFIINGEKPMTLYAPGLVSPTLTWETVTQYDFGIDVATFGNRLNASLDIYRRNTRNMLTKSATLPAILAVSEPQMNAADLKTTGWDMTVEWRQVSGKVTWEVKAILSDYVSVITKYDNPAGLINDYYVGKKIGEIWGFVTKGIAQTDEEARALDMKNLSGRSRAAGDLIFEDLNDDGKITYGEGTLKDPGDRKIIGNNTPRYSFGLTSNIQWKNFDLNVFFQGIAKRDLWLNPTYWIGGYNDEWRAHNILLSDYWTPENRDAFFPRPIITGGTDVTAVQTRWLQNASYVRLKDLTLGYTVPVNLTQKINIDKLRIFFSGNNIWEATGIYKYKKLADPEMNISYQTPINRTYSLGVNIYF